MSLPDYPSWIDTVREHRNHFTVTGFHGLIDHHRVTNALGERLARGELTGEQLAWLIACVDAGTLGGLMEAHQPPAPNSVIHADPRRFWMAAWEQILGYEIGVPVFPGLKVKTREAIETFGLLPVFLPEVDESDYPKDFTKVHWGRNLRVASVTRRALPGRWVLVETIEKPDARDQAGYGQGNDPLGRALRLTSRFNMSFHGVGNLRGRVAQLFGLADRFVRLPSAEEWNLIGNLFVWLNNHRDTTLPDLGSTHSWEWCVNKYGADRHLIVGARNHGGLAEVDDSPDRDTSSGVGFRFLAVL